MEIAAPPPTSHLFGSDDEADEADAGEGAPEDGAPGPSAEAD